jgi:hypothetical protein
MTLCTTALSTWREASHSSTACNIYLARVCNTVFLHTALFAADERARTTAATDNYAFYLPQASCRSAPPPRTQQSSQPGGELWCRGCSSVAI